MLGVMQARASLHVLTKYYESQTRAVVKLLRGRLRQYHSKS